MLVNFQNIYTTAIPSGSGDNLKKKFKKKQQMWFDFLTSVLD